ncbi:hypothetical protein BWI15_21625 [Kribbella sp. ALI-6-A]|uniref:hypothetical protein n=1 Tax=Kribbella sp. ALI-6-A TaxID=1933817 RepID=UPI00097C8DE4|nr:hypothetical protein [Kribbella sp. ALI-6-A]ONI69218.1 hypothetical protein BWI15_21625 [Kribbella sp. ALI-6-A]
MSWLRPRTARAVAAYPEVPVRYHRPFLRVVAGAFLVGESVLGISLTYFPEGKGDDLERGDWWLHLAFLVMLGGLYLYVASSVVVTRTHVVVNNPFRRAEIPLTQVRLAVQGSNLRIKAGHRDFVAAGIEAANAQVASGDYGTQDDVVLLINRAAADAQRADADAVEPVNAQAGRAAGAVRTAGDSAPAGYRFAWPDPLFLAFAVISVVNAVVILFNGGPVWL